MALFNLDDTHTSRSRLMICAKVLFARQGFENVSTAVIAREAVTSESQLVKIFGGKAGLLEAVLNDAWRPINDRVQRVAQDSTNAYEATLGALTELLDAFESDAEFAFLALFEARRVRSGDPAVGESQGATVFNDLLLRMIRRGQKDGSFSNDFNDNAVASALLGVTEGLARERATAQRDGKRSAFGEREVRRILEQVLDSFNRKGAEIKKPVTSG
ncbi:TetR/AcrR family transcriptional regulator [bacterium]|nr:TetR/AcrR family transcriptional regulator [bacterium]